MMPPPSAAAVRPGPLLAALATACVWALALLQQVLPPQKAEHNADILRKAHDRQPPPPPSPPPA